MSGDEYIDCQQCTERTPKQYAVAIDVSPEDELYPEFVYLCQTCGGER